MPKRGLGHPNARKGWHLRNVEDAHREKPDTFWIPPEDARRSLQPDQTVKLIFEPDRWGDDRAAERMWVIVDRRLPDGGYLGRLDNKPAFLAELSPGDPIPFGPEHVCDIYEKSSS